VRDGAYQQTDSGTPASVFAGDVSWSDYTLSLKARKLGGAEGFWIIVRQNGPGNYIVWNLGGMRNQSHMLQFHLGQQDQLVSQVPGSIDAGRWYDVKVELKGVKLDCYLDGKLVQSAEVPPPQVQRLYASAVRDEKAGEIILKVVNPGDDPRMAGIQISGVDGVAPEIKAIVLTAAGLGAENSFEHPLAVAPVESRFNVTGSRFDHRFPQHSMTVLRIKTQ
jgi:alpha-L-arabinofuranosidase